MLSTYNDACLLNESLAYYLSTNYFRNPLFDSDGLVDYRDDEADKRLTEHNLSIQQTRDETSQSDTNSSSNNGMHSYLANKRQRFNKFCDNVTLTFKGKLFVMHLNFKRRLGLVKNYFDRTMPWILPSNARRRQQRESGLAGEQDDDILGSYRGDFNGQPSKEDYHIDGKSFWNDIWSPKSSECLGEQQEKILNRLTRVKRISQKLFNNVDEDHHDVGCENYSPTLNETLTTEQQQTSLKQLDLADSSVPFRSREFSNGSQSAFPIVSSRSMPLGLAGFETSRVDDGVHCAPTASMRNETTTTKAAATSSSRTPLKRKRCFISRSRHIKNAAYALASAKQRNLCIVCYENSPNIVTLPCKHHDICSDCFIEIIYMAVKNSKYPLKCVLCRQKIEKIRCSRRLLLSVIEKNRNSSK